MEWRDARRELSRSPAPDSIYRLKAEATILVLDTCGFRLQAEDRLESATRRLPFGRAGGTQADRRRESSLPEPGRNRAEIARRRQPVRARRLHRRAHDRVRHRLGGERADGAVI